MEAVATKVRTKSRLAVYKTIEIENNFSETEITSAFGTIGKSVVECFAEDDALIFNFDEVDLRYLECEAKNGNTIIQNLWTSCTKIILFPHQTESSFTPVSTKTERQQAEKQMQKNGLPTNITKNGSVL